MTIIIVEDDNLQSLSYVEVLKKAMPGVSVQVIETASDFIQAIPRLETIGPNFIILDLMLPWSFASSSATKAPSGYDPKRGGLFLLKKIKSSVALSEIPLLIWTAVDLRGELQDTPLSQNVHLKYKSDMNPQDMVHHIRSLLIAGGQALPDKHSVVAGIAGGIDVKPSFFGISLDVKKVLSWLRYRKKKSNRVSAPEASRIPDARKRNASDEQTNADFVSLAHDVSSPLLSAFVHLRDLRNSDQSSSTPEQVKRLHLVFALVEQARIIVRRCGIRRNLKQKTLPHIDCSNRSSGDIRRLCAGVVDALIPLWKGVKVVLNFDSEEAEHLRYDWFLLEFCLYELIRIAINSGQVDCEALIEGKPGHDHYSITITGSKILQVSKEQRDIVVATEYEDEYNPPVYSGSICDLWVCDKLLLAQHGRLEITPTTSAGKTTFQIQIARV